MWLMFELVDCEAISTGRTGSAVTAHLEARASEQRRTWT